MRGELLPSFNCLKMESNKIKKEDKKKMIRLTCQRSSCKYEWNYKGKSKFYATCPRCRSTVNIEKQKITKSSLSKES